MSEQQFQSIINHWDIWLACSVMIIIIFIQAVLFLRGAIQEAKRLSFTNANLKHAAKAACITAIGPSLSPVIIAMSMMSIVGSPNAWLNLNNIGAARTEMMNISIGASFAGVTELSSNMGLEAWSYALWACGLCGLGWVLVSFFLIHRMDQLSAQLYTRFEKGMVSAMMGAAVVSMFAYMLCSNVVGKTMNHLIAAVVSAGCMLMFSTVFKKSSVLQELSLGISMLAGMLIATWVQL